MSRSRFLALVISLLPFTGQTQEELVIYTEHFPPYNFQINNKIQGINIDLIKSACKNADIDCDFELYPWQRAYKKSLKTENAGLVSTAYTEERESLFQWVGPLVSGASCFYKLKARHDIVINEKNDLLNYSIGLPWSDVYEEILKNWGFEKGTNYVTFSEKYAYANAFKSDKLDLFIASNVTLPRHLSKLNLSFEDVEPVYLLEDPDLGGNYLALNNNVDQHTVDKLQQEVEKLMSSSTPDDLQEHYIRSRLSDPSNRSNIARQCRI